MSAVSPPTPRQIAEAVLQDDSQRRKLFAYAITRFGISREDSEDLLQDTVLELLRCRSFVRSPEGFVFSVFRARCVRFIGMQMSASGRAASPSPADSLSSDAAAAEGVDSQVALREALSEVSSNCRRLLRAYYVEGQSLREAAVALSLAYSSVAKTINRCLKRLRKCLA